MHLVLVEGVRVLVVVVVIVLVVVAVPVAVVVLDTIGVVVVVVVPDTKVETATVVVVVAMHESHPNGHIVCSAGNAAHCVAVTSVHSGILSWVRSSACAPLQTSHLSPPQPPVQAHL